jgi:hypothetical protein
MAAGRGDRRAGHQEPWPGRDAVVKRVAHRERDVVPAAGVASRRRATQQQPAHVGRRAG